MRAQSGTKPSFKLHLLALCAILQYAYSASSTTGEPEITAVYTWQRDSDSSFYRANKASMVGGTEVVIHGLGMDLTPQNNFVNLECYAAEADESSAQPLYSGAAPVLSHENQLNSNMGRGQLQYTLPSLVGLLGAQDSTGLDGTWCRVHVTSFNDGGAKQDIKCTSNTCTISYYDDMTAGFVRVLPQAIFFNTRTTFFVDTQKAVNQREVGEEMPFRMGFIDQSNTNYEIWLDEDTELEAQEIVEFSGQSGDAPVNKTSEPRLNFHVGDAQINEDSMKTCNYAGDDCYLVRSIGVINKVGSATGNTNGGQHLRLEGFRFNGQNSHTLEVDGVPCAIDDSRTTKEIAFCETGAASAASSAGQYVGSLGLRRVIYKSADAFDLSNIAANTLTEDPKTELLTSFEFPDETPAEGIHTASVVSGWFVPPHTSGTKDYTFHVTCSDHCQLFISKTDMDPSAMEATPIVDVFKPAYKGYYYDSERVDLSSAPQTLETGKHYYMELRHTDKGKKGYAQVAVEVESETPGHQNADREMKYLAFFAPSPEQDTFVISIDNPDSDVTWAVEFKDSENNYYPSSSDYFVYVSGFPSAWDCKRAVSGSYWSKYWSWIEVERVLYDSNGDVTTNTADTTKLECTVKMTKLIDSYSFSSAYILTSKPDSYSGNFEISYTSAEDYAIANSITYDKPFTGSYQIKIPVFSDIAKAQGLSFVYTENISYTAWEYAVKSAIFKAAPEWINKVDISVSNNWNQRYDRKEIYLEFYGFKGDPGAWEIVQSKDDPLKGPNSWISATHFQDDDIHPYNPNSIVYKPVPYEMLFTQHTKPQVIMKVDDLPVGCLFVDCDYMYEDATASMTSFSAPTHAKGDTLTVNGANLATSFVEIKFGGSTCYYDEANSSTAQVKCTFDQALIAGETKPELTDDNGMVPNDNVAAVTIPLVFSSVTTPSNVDVNPNGGTKITITGTGFPADLTQLPADFKLHFPAQSVDCEIQSISSTQIVCEPNDFAGNSEFNSDISMTVNGQTRTHNLRIGTNVYNVDSVMPNSVSPVLKTDLEIQVTTGITLNKDELKIVLDSHTGPEFDKVLNVYKVQNVPTKKVFARFGGAWSGTYDVDVVSDQFGKFASAVTLDVSGTITSFSPTSGSTNGGTIVTLTGTNFDAKDVRNNPVAIYYQNCEVLSSTTTEIVFVTAPQTLFDASGVTPREIVVGLKTSEEAVCNDNVNNCRFSYADAKTPTLATRVVSYDAGEKALLVTFSGSNFGTTGTDKVFFDGLEQVIHSSSDTQVVVKVTKIMGKSVSNIKLYTKNGTPTDDNGLLSNLDFTSDITLIESNIVDGSLGGGVIALTVAGLGPGDDSIDVAVEFGSSQACTSVSIPEYGIVTCTLGANTIGSVTLALNVDGTSIAGVNAPDVAYESSWNPKVTDLSSNGSVLTITGSAFQITEFDTARVSIDGVYASSVTIDSDTQLSATFSSGVPITDGDTNPVVAFVTDTFNDGGEGTDYLQMFATIEKAWNQAFVQNSVMVNPSSYAGGEKLTIANQGGLTSAIEQGSAWITVCGEKCMLHSDSTATSTVCSLPKVTSIYAEKQIGVSTYEHISGTNFGDNTQEIVANAFDGNNQVVYSSGNANCYVGTDFGAGKVGFVTQAAYMMNEFDRDLYVDNLILQGCNVADNQDYTSCSSWTDLKQVGEEIHEGFNYMTFYDSSFANKDKVPHYRLYRFYNAIAGGCEIGEITFEGVIAEPETSATLTCDAYLHIGGTETLIANDIEYKSTLTKNIVSVDPMYGSVLGGETVTFTLDDVDFPASDVTITLDGIDCSSVQVSGNDVSCTFGERTGLPAHTLSFLVDGQGEVNWGSNDFLYVNLWSEEATWGNELPPIEGESVYVPENLNLLVDIAATPVLNLVLIEGSLIFPSEDDANAVTFNRVFEAHIIFINGGLFQVGTEDDPYTSNLEIKLHGKKYGPMLPTFGNKVIANYKGTLDLHGTEHTQVWTELYDSVAKDKSKIEVMGDINWPEGSQIVIAPTTHNQREWEVHTIRKKTSYNQGQNYSTIQLEEKTSYSHFAETETYTSNTESFDFSMRAEVGLLTRNVKIMGVINENDPEEQEYGAHILSHCEGHDCLTTRISYVEIKYAGQAFLLGRYPIHFHRIGDVHNSFVRGNSIYHTFNRALTVHETNYLRVQNNVAFDILGHGFFVEDGVEENNVFDDNLIIWVKRSWSLLMTDQMSAAFFITNPNNIFRRNHVVAAERMGFWFSLEDTSTGPNKDRSICPVGKKLGQFDDNVVHSNGMYGLRLFDQFIPRQRECSNQWFNYDALDGDYYGGNEPICAVFNDLLGWKNGRSCAITKKTGCIQFHDFKCIDNNKASIEFSLAGIAKWHDDTFLQNTAKVVGGAFVGYSNGNSGVTDIPQNPEFGVEEQQDAKGITMPRENFFSIEGASFFKYDDKYNSELVGEMAALYTCSQCFAGIDRNGGMVSHVKDLYFDSTVTRRLKFQTPFNDVVVDIDGSLTDQAPWSSVVADNNQFHIDECGWDKASTDITYEKLGGIVCSPDVQVRGVHYTAATPEANFLGQDLRIIPWDQSFLDSLADDDAREAYKNDEDKYAKITFDNKSPIEGWNFPLATNHRYLVYFGAAGLDFDQMHIILDGNWMPQDHPVAIVHNHTDIRAYVNVTVYNQDQRSDIGKGWKKWTEDSPEDYGTQIANKTFSSDSTNIAAYSGLGKNVHNNVTEKMIYYLLDGTNKMELDILLEGARCYDGCVEDSEEIDIGFIFKWSDQAKWEQLGLTLPANGEDVLIPNDAHVIYDCGVDQNLEYGKVSIQGRLSFQNGQEANEFVDTWGCDSLELKAHNMFVQGGEFLIEGESDTGAVTEYPIPATLTLLGNKEDYQLATNTDVDTGNKNLVVAGKASFHGKERSLYKTRLTSDVNVGDNSICVGEIGDWTVGDELGLTPTGVDPMERDWAVIRAITAQPSDPACLHLISFDDNDPATEDRMTHYHYGSTETDYSDNLDIDMRGEVYLLTRSVKIIGAKDDKHDWGGQILVVDYRESDGDKRSGYVEFNNIQVYNCSQMDTEKAALRFEYNTDHTVSSYVRKSAFSHGKGHAVGIYNSERIELHDNVFFSFSTIGIKFEAVRDLRIERNTVIFIWERDFNESMLLDPRAGYMMGEGPSLEKAPVNTTLKDNGAIGVVYAGFVAPASTCGASRTAEEPSGHTMVYGNYAYAVNGNGWVGYKNENDESQEDCMEIGYFEGWKISESSVVTVAVSKKVVITRVVALDTGNGIIGNQVGVSGDELESWITDSYIKSESSVVRDCPKRHWCSGARPYNPTWPAYTWTENVFERDPEEVTNEHYGLVCRNKVGTMTPVHLQSLKGPVANSHFMLPIEGVTGDSAFAGTAYYYNVTFDSFMDDRPYCGGSKMRAITFNGGASDIVPLTKMTECTFKDTSDIGFAHLFQPPDSWITVSQCGSFPCTGPLNTAINFFRTNFKGERGSARARNFQIIPNNKALANQFDSCEWMPTWNAYLCRNEDYGVLHFESDDDDKGKRNIYPVTVSEVKDEYGLVIDTENQNILNQFREHTCNGIYPGLFRLGRFTALVGLNRFYNIDFTGTIPRKMNYKLQSDKDGIRVQIKYEYKDSFAVTINDQLMPELEFDNNLRAVPPLTGSYCGENKYNPLENSLQFTISTYCSLSVAPRDTIRATIRMQWTLSEFFASGGTTNFVDRLAGTLGIHASTIKVVSVYEGSVVVVFEILEESDDEEQENNLNQIKKKLEQQIAEETLDIGVKVISGSISDVEIDPDYWVFQDEEESPIIVEEEEQEEEQRGEEILVKKSSKDNDSSQMAAIIIIAAALVITATLLVAAYIILKNKFVRQNEQEIAQADGIHSEGSQNCSGVEEDLQKQYVPQVFEEGEKSVKNKKENQDDVVEEDGVNDTKYNKVVQEASNLE